MAELVAPMANKQNKKMWNGRGRSKNRPVMNPAPITPSRNIRNTIISQPNLAPTVVVSRIVNGLCDVTTDGINPSPFGFTFTLNQIPGASELIRMYQTYCIEQIEVWWRPEYTQLVDSALVSNAANVEFYSALDLADGSAPASVDALLEYQSVAHTGITKNHYRKLRPSYLLNGTSPTCVRISTAYPNEKWYAIKVAVPPTGVAMTFRSVVKFKVVLTGLQ